MLDSWNDPQLAKDYMLNADDPDVNWYEHLVNTPAFYAMLPDGKKTVLDFGCGPGEFTNQLKQMGYDVDGCDGSQPMVNLAKSHFSDIDFIVWDGATESPINKLYDVVISKLALHFIEDLNQLVANLTPVINSNGYLLISVPHPFPTIAKAKGTYFERADYDTQIGTYGINVSMIHRSLQDYINPFLRNGFVLTELSEPSITKELIDNYKVAADYAQLPRRLNLCFQKDD